MRHAAALALLIALAAPAAARADGGQVQPALTEADVGKAHEAGHDHDAGEPDGDDHADDDHVAAAPFGLVALHPWTRATAAREALVFVELENGAAGPVTLTGARSPAATSAGIVAFRLVDGVAAYAPIASLPLDPGAEITLAPFGLAIRLEGLSAPLTRGARLPVTLLTDAGALDFVAEVEAADARAHSHAGHSHD